MRWLVIVFAVVVVACVGAAVWLNLPVRRSGSVLENGPAGRPVSDDQFAELVRSDPVAALAASNAAYREHAAGFTAEFRKRERVGGKLGGEEVIDVAVKDDPYSVLMVWREGGGAGKGTVYVEGANGGKMKVWMYRVSVLDVDPQGPLPKQSARYTIEEFGLLKATQKTRKAWAAAKEAGRLEAEYLGRRAVPEAGGRECFVVRRTCPADQIDPFISGGEAVVVDDKNRRDSFRTVTVYFDCETQLQVGTEQHRHDGELTASYWFRNVNLKPTFDENTFTTKSFK
jgi:hypothetical protein